MINLPTLKILLFSSFVAINTTPAIAQITPDNTLGAESSRVIPNGTIDKIDGGALRDRNLFHSFEEFNINNGQSVYFSNPSGIENILTRVTGKNASNIFGTLGVDGAANLFLINPNGIVFGENARLDLGGSFVGTTASGLQFGEQGSFSATNPEAPGLLTVNPNALLFNQLQENVGIVNKSQGSAGINPNGDERTGLRVPDGKSLLLVGGDINLDGGNLNAYEGHIELASVAAPGTIGLDISGNTFGLNVPQDVERGNISLANQSRINVFGEVGGNVLINANNLEISNSFIFAGTAQQQGNPDAQSGDVNLNTTGFIELKDGAFIDNSVNSQGNAGDIFLEASNFLSLGGGSIIANNIRTRAVGKGGNINIAAASLSLTDGSQIQAILGDADLENNLPGGQGNLGNINIDVRDTVTIAGVKDESSSAIFGFVGTGAMGNSGNISINTGSLSLSESSEINSVTYGKGNAGNITVNAIENISLDGSGNVTFADGSSNTTLTRILNSVNPGALGNAGDIQLNSGSISVTNGALIGNGVYGKGDGANIILNARDTINFDAGGSVISYIVGAVGKSGDIRVTTGNLSLTNGSQLSSNVLGQGNSGNILVEARESVKLDGKVGSSISGIQTYLLTGGIGKGGDIQITTPLLSVTNEAGIFADTDGQGDAGNIIVNAPDAVIFDSLGRVSSAVTPNGIGNGGDISITTGELLLKNNSLLITINSGKGNAGNIFLDARDAITFDNVSLASSFVSNDNGNAGNIEIETGSLFLTNNSSMLATAAQKNSDSITNAGNIIINARDTVKIDGASSLNSQLLRGLGKGGDIQITTGSFSLTNGAKLSAVTFGQGNAGNININARDTITFDQRSSATTEVSSDAVGNGGDIEITADSLFFNDGGFISTQTDGKGNAGNIIINTSTFDAVNGGYIVARTFSSGNAGNITLNVKDKINLSGTGQSFSGGLFANTSAESTGKGGSIFIDPRLVIIENGAGVSVASDGTGDAGDIFLQGGTLTLDKGFITAQTATTQGGNINLQLGELLLLRNGSEISTTAGNQQFGGNGGNIDINSPFIVALPNEDSDITANAFAGNGGNVDIITQGIFGIQPRSQITSQSDITASSETGIQGEISITDPDINPTQGVIELPDGLVDRSNQIAQICPRGVNAKRLSEFYITGRGSLPPNPLNLLEATVELSRLATLDGESGTEVEAVKVEAESKEIVEAQGFMKAADGEIYLVAQAPTTTALASTTKSACVQAAQK